MQISPKVMEEDVETIYEIPLVLNQQNFDNIVIKKLGMKSKVHDESLHILEDYIVPIVSKIEKEVARY